LAVAERTALGTRAPSWRRRACFPAGDYQWAWAAEALMGTG